MADADFAACIAKANAAAAVAAATLAQEKAAEKAAVPVATATTRDDRLSVATTTTAATTKAAAVTTAAPKDDDSRFIPMCKVAIKAGRRKNGKAICGSEAQDLYGCYNNVCQSFVHPNCSTRILNYGDVPIHNGPTEPKLVFCTVTCFRKFESKQKAEQKKVEREAKKAVAAEEKGKTKKPWDADGSLQHLMDWLTTEPNYSHYCGGEGNDGKSKAKCHKELVLMLKEKVPGFDRTEKDVKNKIEKLVSQFNVACDWLGNTGQGLKEEGKFASIEEYITRTCPHYYEFEPIMGDRPSARLLVNSDAMEGEPFSLEVTYSSDEDDEEEDDDQAPAPTVAEMARSPIPAPMPALPPMNLSPLVAAPAAATPIAPIVPAPVVTAVSATANNTPQSSVTTSTTSTKKKKQRLTGPTSSASKKKSGAASTDDLVNKILGGAASSLSDRAVMAKEREADANERMADAKEREADARMLEAKALDKKLAAETELLNDDVVYKRLMKRKQALAEGLCSQEELDTYFPMPKKK